jgi:hypothetical protein
MPSEKKSRASCMGPHSVCSHVARCSADLRAIQDT